MAKAVTKHEDLTPEDEALITGMFFVTNPPWARSTLHEIIEN